MSTRGARAAAPARVFYGWWIVAGSFVLQSLQFGLMFLSFGAYLVQLQRDFGWSRSAISGAFSMSRLETGFLGPLEGWLVDRFGPRAILRVGMVIFGGSFMLLAFVNSLPAFYAVFVLLSTGAALAGFLPFNTSLANWFVRRRAMAMALAQTGQSLGGVLAPAVAWAMIRYGWRETAFVSGIIVIVVGLPTAQLFRRNPEDHGMLPDGLPPRAAREGPARVPGEVNYTVRQALRQRAFWFIGLGHSTSLLVVSGIQVHLVAHLVDSAGWSVPQASTAVAVITVFAAVGQLCGGVLGDRLDKRLIAGCCMVGHGTAMALLTFGSGWPVVAAASALHGVSWGTRGPLMAAMRADYFGRRHFASIMGTSNVITMVGTVVGPIFLGAMYDAIGNYRIAFLTLGLITAAGSLFFWFTPKPLVQHARPVVAG